MTIMTPPEIDVKQAVKRLGDASLSILQSVRDRVRRNLYSKQFALASTPSPPPVRWPILLAGVAVLIERHGPLVYRTAYALTGSNADAENIFQTIFMRLLAREVPSDVYGALEPYFYKAAFNQSLKAIRDRKREKPGDDFNNGTADFDRRLQEAIAALDPAASQMLILHDVHGYSFADIAAMLGTTSDAAAECVSRSHARLRRHLCEPL